MAKIVTLTINPAVDIVWEVDDMVPIRKLRSSTGAVFPGGGGINVSRVISVLGGESTAVITRGGLTGALLTELLDELGLSRRVIRIAGHTRLSATVYERSSGQEFRVTPPGPELKEDEWESFLNMVDRLQADYIVATGSIARGVPANFYGQVAQLAKRHGARMILDTSGRALFEALKEGVYVVKPNQRELENLVGRKASNEAQQVDLARQIIDEGRAEVVALTLGEEGALLVSKEVSLRLQSPPVDAKSAVGAGDSFVGGLTYGLAQGRSLEDAFALAVATGTASVLTTGTELCHLADVERLYEEIRAPMGQASGHATGQRNIAG